MNTELNQARHRRSNPSVWLAKPLKQPEPFGPGARECCDPVAQNGFSASQCGIYTQCTENYSSIHNT
jgi:hypothetical protein